jgi:hypothetical protein
MINTIKFEFLLVEKLGLDLKQCKLLIQILDKDRLNIIKYTEFLSWIADSENIKLYINRIMM